MSNVLGDIIIISITLVSLLSCFVLRCGYLENYVDLIK